jgi:hypothetical protein
MRNWRKGVLKTKWCKKEWVNPMGFEIVNFQQINQFKSTFICYEKLFLINQISKKIRHQNEVVSKLNDHQVNCIFLFVTR